MERLKIDPAHATDEQIRAWLYAIIDAELEKPKGQEDKALIGECSECLLCLDCEDERISDEQLREGLNRIKSASPQKAK